MTLGNVGKASAAEFVGKRKVLIVPYVTPTREDAELEEMIVTYWTDAVTQVLGLQSGLGTVTHLFHEGSVGSGAEAVDILKLGNPHGFQQVNTLITNGAVLEPTEDVECLKETLDLHRCMAVVEVSHTVAERLAAWFEESRVKRYAAIAANVDKHLEASGVAVLVISPDHQVKFPSDVETVYVVPPILDRINKWLRDHSITSDVPSDKPEPMPERAPDEDTPGWARK
jgi:hypothetical protein